MDQDSTLAQPVAKRLNLIRCSQREIMICQPHAPAFSFLQFCQQVCNVESRADVEVWLIKRQIELKHGASRPTFKVEIVRHGDELYPALSPQKSIKEFFVILCAFLWLPYAKHRRDRGNEAHDQAKTDGHRTQHMQRNALPKPASQRKSE